MIIHIDCNNFFASCEVAANPSLRGRPVVVANTNEAGGGIILALTAEAKQLGLKRGNPIFQVRKLIVERSVTIVPVNHRMYREVSRRIMQLVVEQDIVREFVQYSIDEFFGTIPIDNDVEVRNYMIKVKNLITNTTSIPVSCGCSLTYTLAKTATWYAKHYAGYKGICVISEANREKALKKLPIGEVWGLGRSSSGTLLENGIKTAYDFTQQSEYYVKHIMGVTGQRIWCELKGVSSIELGGSSMKKSVMHSRTFDYMTEDKDQLRIMLAGFASSVAAKLRQQQSVCSTIGVFLRTNPHRLDLPQLSVSDEVKLQTPTQDTVQITRSALEMLNKIYRSGFLYKRMGIVLSNIIPNSAVQLDLFDQKDVGRSGKLMKAIDEINRRFGEETIHSAISDGAKANTSENDSESGE